MLAFLLITEEFFLEEELAITLIEFFLLALFKEVFLESDVVLAELFREILLLFPIEVVAEFLRDEDE